MSKDILGVLDGFDVEGLKALIESLEQSSFDYMKLESGDVAITIGKNGAEGMPHAAAEPAPAIVETIVSAATPAVEPANIEEAASVESTAEEGLIVIRSPSYGIFYAQSEPGAAPYVTLGAAVKAGQTVCLVEIMKTFNAVTSPADGEVVAIHIQNAELLEPEQPLFSIRVK